ncbi:hypothetical protein ACB098_02G191500 [Castanea mollissima]
MSMIPMSFSIITANYISLIISLILSHIPAKPVDPLPLFSRLWTFEPLLCNRHFNLQFLAPQEECLHLMDHRMRWLSLLHLLLCPTNGKEVEIYAPSLKKTEGKWTHSDNHPSKSPSTCGRKC